MKIIGLTGGIASGKNFVAEAFAKKGAVVFDADVEVHKLLQSSKSTIQKVRDFFPESFVNKKIDRKILGKIVFSNTKKLDVLEKILHPEVRKIYQKFLQKARKEKNKIIILNIPLLLERQGYECDYIIAILVSKKVQKERFLQREKKKNPQAITSELNKKFKQIIGNQLSNAERKKAANFVIKNSSSKAETLKQVEEILRYTK